MTRSVKARRSLGVIALLLALSVLSTGASPAAAARRSEAREPVLTYGMLQAIAADIRTGPLGTSNVMLAEVRTARDAESLLRTLGLGLEDLWWVPDADGNGRVEALDAARMMSALGGYADQVTADRVARALAANGFLSSAAIGVVDPTPKPPTHIEFFSHTWTDHAADVSATYPPNHIAFITGEWNKPGHTAATSKNTWPPNHRQTISLDWLPGHTTANSKNVPPNHSWETSKTWPMDTHSVARSRTWPPEHSATVSALWPDGHKYALSTQQNPNKNHTETFTRSWPDSHEAFTSNRDWPPGHYGPHSNIWAPDHMGAVSKNNWPPSHTLGISKTWKDGQTWPSNHHQEVSESWPATPAAEVPGGGVSND